MKKTLDYYDINALGFFESIFKVDMESLYQPFLHYLSDNAFILNLDYGLSKLLIDEKIQPLALSFLNNKPKSLVNLTHEANNVEYQ